MTNTKTLQAASSSPLPSESYGSQSNRWPSTGRHILASFDESSVIVYQAYRPSIGHYAIQHGRLGGADFSFSRMSWIKPNFLWMMYRSGWGTKDGQTVLLALRIRRNYFDSILAAAVPSSFDAADYPGREQWQQAVAASEVRLQWDPDHDPAGHPLQRRAAQLGLRGTSLAALAGPELLEVLDISGFAAAQYAHVRNGEWQNLETPVERVYVPADPAIARRIGLDAY
jgi:hypothetical protein